MGESNGNAIATITTKGLSYPEIEKTARAFVASGMFGRDMDKISKGITKIMAGQELGLAPFASMRAIHVIEGNATLSANTMAGMVKSSGRYDYEIVKKEVDGCTIDFFEIHDGKKVKVGTESFDESEARSAGLLNKQNWQKYPKAMMFARCISNGVRTYCPDVFSGIVVYTPDELDKMVTVKGEIIDQDIVEKNTNLKISNGDNAVKAEEVEDIDQTPVEDDMPIHDIDNEGTEDHPDLTDPNEPEITEDDLNNVDLESVELPVPEPLKVDDEMKETIDQMIDALELHGPEKIRLIKEATGVVALKLIKTDEQWISLFNKCNAIIGGSEDVEQ